MSIHNYDEGIKIKSCGTINFFKTDGPGEGSCLEVR